MRKPATAAACSSPSPNADQPVAVGALAVGLAHERRLAAEPGPQLEQGAGGEGGLAGADLADGHARQASAAARGRRSGR